MANKVIWYISKYAWTPSNHIVNRQFNFSKNFVKKGCEVYLFSSYSCGHKTDLTGYHEYRRYYYKELLGVHHILIKGPYVDLGLNVKRIISWLIFEWNLWLIVRKLKAPMPDSIIVSSLSILTVLNGFFFKRKFKSKFVFEVRDIWPQTLIDIGGFSKWNPVILILRFIEKFGYRNADVIVGTMPKLDSHVRNSINQKFEFKWIPTGVDLEQFEDITLADSVVCQIPTDKFLVAYTGAIGNVNCVDEIVDAADILKDNQKIHFLILGDGPLKKEMIQRARNLKNVTFIHKIDKKYVNSFLKKCSVLLHPVMKRSIYNYGISPNKWIDYMLSGKPVIVSYDGYQSFINEANCGVFIPAQKPVLLAAEIKKFSKYPQSALDEMGNAGQKFVKEELNYSYLADKYLEVLR
jgi:glycosyltransferase involved in cell wall biosynthesis